MPLHFHQNRQRGNPEAIVIHFRIQTVFAVSKIPFSRNFFEIKSWAKKFLKWKNLHDTFLLTVI